MIPSLEGAVGCEVWRPISNTGRALVVRPVGGSGCPVSSSQTALLVLKLSPRYLLVVVVVFFLFGN